MTLVLDNMVRITAYSYCLLHSRIYLLGLTKQDWLSAIGKFMKSLHYIGNEGMLKELTDGEITVKDTYALSE